MNKSELIEAMSENADMSKASSARVLDSLIDSVSKTLGEGGSVVIPGFGSFSISERAARTGRNPQTGAEIKIEAAKVPKFKAGKTLKDSVR